MAKRGITYVLAHAFGIIPVVTDNPDYIRMLKVKKEKKNWLRQRENVQSVKLRSFMKNMLRI